MIPKVPFEIKEPETTLVLFFLSLKKREPPPNLLGSKKLVAKQKSITLKLSSLSLFLSASTPATYIFTTPLNCTTTIISLEPCALNAEYRRFSY